LLTFWRSFRHLNQLLAHRLNTVVSSAYSKPDFFVQSRCRICSNWNAVTKLQCDKVSSLLDHFPNRYCNAFASISGANDFSMETQSPWNHSRHSQHSRANFSAIVPQFAALHFFFEKKLFHVILQYIKKSRSRRIIVNKLNAAVYYLEIVYYLYNRL
jgi:hypothetical protein